MSAFKDFAKDSNQNDLFLEEGGGVYTIKSDNVFADDNQLKLYQIYELITFIDSEPHHRFIKLMAAYLKNSKEYAIIAIDIESNEVIKRSKKFEESNKWLIVEPLYLSDELQKKVRAYCDKIIISNYCNNKPTVDKYSNFSFSEN